jgi:hypothetical protein
MTSYEIVRGIKRMRLRRMLLISLVVRWRWRFYNWRRGTTNLDAVDKQYVYASAQHKIYDDDDTRPHGTPTLRQIECGDRPSGHTWKGYRPCIKCGFPVDNVDLFVGDQTRRYFARGQVYFGAGGHLVQDHATTSIDF